MKKLIALFLLACPIVSFAQWVNPAPDVECSARHEAAAVIVEGKYYLMGGRGMKPIETYDINNNQWDSVGSMPIEMHHMQALSIGSTIYIAGAFTGGFPHEVPLDNLYTFDTKSNSWTKGAEVPNDRKRGGAGAVVYNDKIYLVAGITDGHWEGHVTWFDEYDPATNQWRKLPDAPHARDHFQAVVIGDKLYVAGGRRTSTKTEETFSLVETAVDVYDFKTNTWTTLDESNNIPTPRGGCTVVPYKKNFIVIGGESGLSSTAHSEVEMFDTKKMNWTSLPSLLRGRHGTQAGVYENKIIIGSGCGNRGGNPELSSIEVYDFK